MQKACNTPELQLYLSSEIAGKLNLLRLEKATFKSHTLKIKKMLQIDIIFDS